MTDSNEWVSKSNAVRDAGSPQDLVTVFRRSPNFIDTVPVPFSEGSRVLVYPVLEAVVVKNPVTGVNEITYDAQSSIGGSVFMQPLAGVIIEGKNQQTQTSFTAI
jgi:hypothetical protein